MSLLIVGNIQTPAPSRAGPNESHPPRRHGHTRATGSTGAFCASSAPDLRPRRPDRRLGACPAAFAGPAGVCVPPRNVPAACAPSPPRRHTPRAPPRRTLASLASRTPCASPRVDGASPPSPTRRRTQMGKVNFGYILGWSVVFMVVIHRIVSLIAPPSQARAVTTPARVFSPCITPVWVTQPNRRRRALSSTGSRASWATACSPSSSSRRWRWC